MWTLSKPWGHQTCALGLCLLTGINLDLLNHKYVMTKHKSVSLTVTEVWTIKNFHSQFDFDLISEGHHKKYDEYCKITIYLITVNHRSVFLAVTQVWSIINFKCWFDLDLIFQGHNKYGKWCPVISSLIVINHKSVSLMVTEIWPTEYFEGWFDLNLISQGHHKYDTMMPSDIISNCGP